MQNHSFFRNLVNGCITTTKIFNATNYYNAYKDSLKCYDIKQNYEIGSIKDNAILFLKDKPLNTCVNINGFIYINFEGSAVNINLSL